MEQGRADDAEQLFHKAIALARALETNYYLGISLAGLAQLYTRQGRVATALPLAEEALGIAAEESNKGDELLLRCLVIQLRAAGGQLPPPQAEQELHALLAAWPESGSQAEIYYTMWLLDPRQDEPRRIAAEFYSDAYTRTPDVLYARRFEELTGETLPPPPPLPPLPALVPPAPADLPTLLAPVEQLLAELRLSPPAPPPTPVPPAVPAPLPLPDHLWDRIAPLLPPEPPRPQGGRPPMDNRRVLNAILYVLGSGIPWHALPREFGAPTTVHGRFRAWQQDGVFTRLRQAGVLDPDLLARAAAPGRPAR
jgi:transposase